MIEIQTKKNSVKVYTDDLDKQTRQQIAATARDPAYVDSKIRVMPDTHAARGCVIGMTMTLHGRVSPSLVGVDIGCGMEVVKLAETEIDLPGLDAFIREYIPTGKAIYEDALPAAWDFPFHELYCSPQLHVDRSRRSLGTLGGGNHFIEVDRGEDGALYLVIHSGSRSLGTAVANHYRDAAYKYHCQKARRVARHEYRDRLDQEYEGFDLGRFCVDAYGDNTCGMGAGHSFTKATRREGQEKLPVKWENATCEGKLFEEYLHDMEIAVHFAAENRKQIAMRICEGMKLHPQETHTCIHNYIDTDCILRKGAISARQGEFVFIPLNMRDGAWIGYGLGNPDWNFSAPHGAGRACSRTDAKYAYDVETYQQVMRQAGVYTTTATKETLDECPMAYKSMDRILPYLNNCVEIVSHVKPIYNFKAEE